MKMNVSQKLIVPHLVRGKPQPESEVLLMIDQTLTQDATGTLVMLEFEAMNCPSVRTELSVQYVDHNLLQEDFKNADDHLFLQSAAQRYGLWFCGPGDGISHVVHMQRFGAPGKTMLGSDSHTPAAGSLGMLAIGAGGLDVALAMAGEPFRLTMPRIWGVELTGALPPWVSAKDIILEMLRRHGVAGGLGRIIEYHGPGLQTLSAMDRHVIANMGAELGATTSVFPSDQKVKEFLESQGRQDDWTELKADPSADYDVREKIDLSKLEPLIACPRSPGNVKPVREVAGPRIYQSYIGSSANPGFRDFAVSASMVEGRHVQERVSFDINPSSRQILQQLVSDGSLGKLIAAGARIHQAGCNGCIGMGQAPATGRISLRTVPRNFPGRSGTREDQVYLCSPETATASALRGVITDPRTLDFEYPKVRKPEPVAAGREVSRAPEADATIELVKGPNIKPLPRLGSLAEHLRGRILLKVGDAVSTDEILPAGARVLPYRSNLPEISRFAFGAIDDTFYDRALATRKTGSFLLAGDNYGQGSSREHAALVPRFLGVKAVLAKSFARIHRQNLINFGILPLRFVHPEDYDGLDQNDEIQIESVHDALRNGNMVHVRKKFEDTSYEMNHDLSSNEVELLMAGGRINRTRASLGSST